jgi:hypothetical protein
MATNGTPAAADPGLLSGKTAQAEALMALYYSQEVKVDFNNALKMTEIKKAFLDQENLNGTKALNPRCFGVWGVVGKKVEAKKSNRVSAK